jgi:ribonuclease R
LNKQKDPSGEDIQKQILTHMAEGTYRPLKPKELARAIKVPQSAYSTFRLQIRAMLGRGDVIRLRRGRLALPDKLDLIRGRVHAHRKGFAFVIPEAGGNDLYIDPDHLKTAMHNDTVLIQKLSTSFRGKPEGRVVRIVKRGHPKIVGTFQKGRHFFFVVPEDERLPRDVYIPPGQSLDAEPGQIVVVDLAEWDDPARSPEGRVVEILGFPDDPGVDVLTVIFEHALPLAFPSDITDEAKAISARIPKSEIERRMDCRDLAVVTIDPKDAKDHDDALSVRDLGNGLFEVGVHIADVSHYVSPGSGLDREALLRGTSVYLVDRVIPMLPERLSGDLCSLRAGVDRLALSCFLTLDGEARLKKFRMAETCVRSAADMTYEQVQEYFDDGKIGATLKHMAGPLDSLLALSQKLTGRRMAAGSLDFDLPEARIELALDGSVSDIYQLVRLSSHRLVEEFMLLANKTVARYLQTTGVPVLYRVHDRPSQEKLEIFSGFVESLGLKFKAGPELKPKHLQKLIEQVKGIPEEGLVNEVLLRSMSKAVYQPENIGHFGLAFDRYVHFTSPIRRYPDLTVHRAVKRKLAGQITPDWTRQEKKEIAGTGRHTSQRERVAMEAERDSVRIKQIAFMETQLGEEFTGLISGVRAFGLFVKLDRILVEGLIPIGTLGDDYYHVDEERFRARGRSTGRRFRLGDPVTVQVVRVDPVSKQVDFKLVIGGDTGDRAGGGKNTTRVRQKRKAKRAPRRAKT